MSTSAPGHHTGRSERRVRHSTHSTQCTPRSSPEDHSTLLPPLYTFSPPSGSSGSCQRPPRPLSPPKGSSLLEKHAINSYAAKKTQLPLSIYELPTATFMWARWNPGTENVAPKDPVMFVKYRPPPSDIETASTCSRPPSPQSVQTASSRRPSPVSTPPPTSYRKRASSTESDDESPPPSPSDRFIKHRRVSTTQQFHKLSLNAYGPQVSDDEFAPRARSIESDMDDSGIGPALHFYPAHQSNSPTSMTRDAQSTPPSAVPTLSALVAAQVDPTKQPEWLNYAKPTTEGSLDFMCTWLDKRRDGSAVACTYVSKKHLVKRHVESKHLQYRPCVCQFCGKGFSQKSNLDTHVNTHTGKEPHKCLYCPATFKDPARRHRHMLSAHKHRTSRTKRGRMLIEAEAGIGATVAGEGPESDIDDTRGLSPLPTPM